MSSVLLLGAAALTSAANCHELETALRNAERTESYLMVQKFNRSGSEVTPVPSDGNLYGMWQQLQVQKQERLKLYRENCLDGRE